MGRNLYCALHQFNKKIETGSSRINHIDLVNQSSLNCVKSVMKISNKTNINNKIIKRKNSLLTGFGIKDDLDDYDDESD